tara:strand:- start:34 stop:510 length:477 start_codon:yes stop_codon:yes gene_type:complete
MLHSKFSTSYDARDSSVTIFIQQKVNNENYTISRTFYFDQQGKLILDDPFVSKDSFKLITRHVKSTIPKFKAYLEDGFKDQGNAKYEVVRETLYNDLESIVGYSVTLLEDGECIDEYKIPEDVESIASFGLVESKSFHDERYYANDCFYNESKLIQNT